MPSNSIGEISATLKLKDELTPQLKVATREIGKFGPELEQAANQAPILDRALRGAGVAFGIVTAGATAAIGALTAAGAAIVTLGQRGSVIAGVADSFDALAASVNETSSALLTAGRSGTQGLVSDMQLMEAANKAILLGLPVTRDEFETLGQTAIALGRAMKQGPEESLNDLITGLGRGSAQILDNLGIMVDATAANEKYADSLRKSADDLTASERKTALFKQAMADAAETLKILGESQLTFGDYLQKGRVFITNTVDELSRLIATSPVITSGMEAIATALSEAFGGKQQSLIEITVTLIEHAAIAMVQLGSIGVRSVKVLGQAFFALLPTIEKWLLMMSALNLAASRLPGVGSAAESAGKALLDATLALAQLNGRGDEFSASMDRLANGLDHASAAMRSQIGTSRSLGDAIGRLAGAGSGGDTTGITKLTESAKKLFDALSGADAQKKVNDYAAAIRAMGGVSALSAGQLREVAGALLDLERSGATLPRSLRDVVDEFRSLGDVSIDVNGSLKEMNEHMDNAAPSLDAFWRSATFVTRAMREMNAAVSVDVFAPIQHSASRITQSLGEIPRKGTEGFVQMFGTIADGFRNMAQVGGEVFGTINRSIGLTLTSAVELVKGFDLFQKGREQVRLLREGFAGMEGGVLNIVAGLGQMAGAMGQLIGMAVQLGKALHDAFTRSEAEKAAADIRRTLGVDVDEDNPIAQAIEQLVKSGKVRNRNEAIALNLDEILEQAGGVTAGNFKTFLSRSVELFDLIARGGEVGEMAFESLDTILGELGAHVIKQGGIWDQHFIAVLQRAQAEGLNLSSVIALLNGEMDKVSSGLASLTEAFVAKLESSGRGASDGSWMDAIVGDPQKALEVQTEFDRLSRTVFASFNAFIAQGKSAVDAIRLLGPSIDDLTTAADDFGLAGNEAFEALRRWHDLVSQNQALVNSVSALNDVVTGLANIGGLTVETFADLQAQGVQAFNDLIDAGFTEQEALAQMVPFLETLIELHKQRGLAIDAETMKLIAQAEEQGLLNANALSTNDILMAGLQGLADLFGDIFGVQVPDLFRRMVDEAEGAADGVERAFKNLDLTLPSLSIPGIPGLDVDGIPQFAEGGIVRKPTFGLFGEAGPEAILPLSDLQTLLSGVAAPVYDVPASQGGVMVINNHVDARGAFFRDREDLKHLAMELLPDIARETQRQGLTRVG